MCKFNDIIDKINEVIDSTNEQYAKARGMIPDAVWTEVMERRRGPV